MRARNLSPPERQWDRKAHEETERLHGTRDAEHIDRTGRLAFPPSLLTDQALSGSLETDG